MNGLFDVNGFGPEKDDSMLRMIMDEMHKQDKFAVCMQETWLPGDRESKEMVYNYQGHKHTLIKHNKTKITTTSSTEEIEEFDDALGESLLFPEATDVLWPLFS